MPDIVTTVVRNGLRNLLPALSSFQPFPSEMFGVLPDVSNLQSRLPSGTPALFLPGANSGDGKPVSVLPLRPTTSRLKKRHRPAVPLKRNLGVATGSGGELAGDLG
jgi:hypothetical protein